jgi:hypothetical protein
LADDPSRHWKLDAPTSADFTPKGGKVRLASGVKGKSLALDGRAVLELKDSAKLTHVEKGFTFVTWVNPYRLNAGQQMIVAKNVYAKNHREWSVMIDRDNRFTLYLYQGKWQTVKADTPVKLGHWFQVGVVIKPGEAELWVNGKRGGTRKLVKPLPQTAAPFTLGGVNDNGRIWQNLFGALDEARFYDRPLSPKEITGLYRPVAATHKLPARVAQGSEGFPLWGGSNLPKTSQAEVLKGVQFHVIKKWERKVDGYGFLHGVALAWHKGKLYASFGHNKGSENTLTEEGRYCVSEDGGKTWSKVQTIDVGVGDDNLAVSHGVFLSREQTLWAFLGSFYGTRKGVHTRAYTLDEKNGQWQPQGTVVKDGFWPMTEPVKMVDGNWIMPGFIVGKGNPAAVAISTGDDLKKWKPRVIPRGAGVRSMWGESSIIVDGAQITNIARYGGAPLALAAMSKDYGRTWTSSAESNLPMATSKPCSGVLSTGQRYLICSTTADGGGRRSPLTIAVGKQGENKFSKVFVIRHAVFPEGPGESHRRAALSYPYATEYQGKLYVCYSNNGERNANNNSAELAVIPLSSLAIQ